ncbi:hypothetical protein AB4099_27255 [Bosea sp. 2KB_26]|uniref:hypothetical protein n=1 Tax=Bosea sp. 2KB_26 TaxID=3237475 RepID=UPI003F9149AD
MGAIVFTANGNFIVVRNGDGPLAVKGLYRGAPIKTAIPFGPERCFVLIDPESSRANLFENLLCIGKTGRVLWRATLPSVPDAFVEARLSETGLLAYSRSGYRLVIDPATGGEIEKELAK